jgi:hypothetical protein
MVAINLAGFGVINSSSPIMEINFETRLGLSSRRSLAPLCYADDVKDDHQWHCEHRNDAERQNGQLRRGQAIANQMQSR